MKYSATDLVADVEQLCSVNFAPQVRMGAIERLSKHFDSVNSDDEFSYRQLNEVLLLLNERIVSKEFFNFLASLDGAWSPLKLKSDATIRFRDFKKNIQDFRKLSMLEFGSFRFAYNYLSDKEGIATRFEKWLRDPGELEALLKSRTKAVCEIESIAEDETPYMSSLYDYGGNDSAKKVRQTGIRNFDAYLTYDYLDVYVATSMRKPWEYKAVHRLCNKVFKDPKLGLLKVRYFDPTISYSDNSICKSLIEGLMLKRAKCTLYLVQETDTLGKDSEMASTLAQGKPVIAFVPKIEERERIKQLKEAEFLEVLWRANLVISVAKSEQAKQLHALLEKFGEIVEKNKDKPLSKNESEYQDLLEQTASLEREFYDDRYNKLRDKHPLRFQIDLNNGVANGVLVVRTEEECAELIRRVLTNELDFSIIEPGSKQHGGQVDDQNYLLVESLSKCAFRVVTKNEKLTNSFWNLYKRDRW